MKCRLRTRVFISCFPAFLISCVCFAATPATLVGPDLQPRRVQLQAIGNGEVTFFDTDRKLVTEPISGLVQIRDLTPPTETSPPAPAPALIELTDGQRLAGKLVGAAEDGQTFTWDHPLLGKVTISIDHLRALRAGKAAPTAAAEQAEGDLVILANGDTLRGFVSGFTRAGVQIKPEDRDEPITLPLDRIGTLTLANPARPDAPPSHLLWLADGSRIAASELNLAGDTVRLRTPRIPEAEVSLPVAELTRIDLASAAGRLIELTQREPGAVSGGDVFGVPMPPRVEGGALRLHAPVAVTYELPAGAARLAAEASLDVPETEQARAKEWADFELIARVDGKEAGRWRITGAKPGASINVPIAGKSLVLELDAGANGPVFDRLKLSNAVVLVAE